MGLGHRAVKAVRKFIGTDPDQVTALERQLSDVQIELRDLKALIRDHFEALELIKRINHTLVAVYEGAESDRVLLGKINHSSMMLHDIAPRVIALDELRHKLTYAEAIASDHARAAALDAETVAVLLRTIERRFFGNPE